MQKEFKVGDRVVMHSCGEATFEEYKGKIWTCKSDTFVDKVGDEVVFLEGFSGWFLAKYLEKVNMPDLSNRSELIQLAGQIANGLLISQHQFTDNGVEVPLETACARLAKSILNEIDKQS